MRFHVRISSVRLLIATLSGLVLILAVQGCNTQEIPCTWAPGQINVDGRGDDWQGVAGTHFSEQNAALAVSNDQDFIYILFRTTDIKWVRTIRQTGLKIFLDVKGKKSKDFFVRFRGGPDPEQLMTRSGRTDDQNASPDGRMRGQGMGMMEKQPPGLTCYIKDKIIEKPIPIDGAEGPAAAYDTCRGFYTYEFRIPLAESLVRFYGIGAAPGQKIGIGGVWGDMSEMKSDTRGGGDRPPGGGMGGGRPGGGMRGGPGGGGQRPNMPEKQEVWVKTTLAVSSKQTSSDGR